MIAFPIQLLLLCSTSFAFAPIANNAVFTSNLEAVRFDKTSNLWITDDPEEKDGSSYGPIGSLYRAGPKPFLSRIFNAQTYDQAVLKYMAQDGCSRIEAQANMDAFLENPQARLGVPKDL
eukprot:scaffold904_cov201-Alexandrium_tamarense.AAC.22